MTQKADTGGVAPVYVRLLEAWNRRHAGEFAALFTQDGSVVGFDGSPMNGREEISSTLNAIFAHHQTASYVAKVREIRLLRSDVALLRAVAGMVPPGQAELNPAVNAVQSVLFVNENSEWQVALLHNTPAAFHGRPEMAEQLTEELAEVVRSGRIVLE